MGKELTTEERALINARRNAVDSAWKNERTLVFMGRGTRDWTPEQQRELIETGRISGFQGHHMSSVKDDPENAGNRDNIQFLTDEEHLAAHGGNFQNATCGRYDPASGRMVPFENGEIVPVSEIELSDPIHEYVDLDQILREVQMEEYSEKIDAILAEHKEALAKEDALTSSQKEALMAKMDEAAAAAKENYRMSLETGTKLTDLSESAAGEHGALHSSLNSGGKGSAGENADNTVQTGMAKAGTNNVGGKSTGGENADNTGGRSTAGESVSNTGGKSTAGESVSNAGGKSTAGENVSNTGGESAAQGNTSAESEECGASPDEGEDRGSDDDMGMGE